MHHQALFASSRLPVPWHPERFKAGLCGVREWIRDL
jgi:hypothetical protein